MILIDAQRCRIQLSNFIKLPECNTIWISWRSQTGCQAESVGSVKVCKVQNNCKTYPVNIFELQLSYMDCENGCLIKWKETSDSQRFNCILIHKSIITPNYMYTEVCSNVTCIPFIGRVKPINSSSDIDVLLTANLEFTNFTTSTCSLLMKSMRNGTYRPNDEIEVTNYCYTCSLNMSSSPHTIFAYAQLPVAADNNSATITQLLNLEMCDSTYVPLSTTTITGNLIIIIIKLMPNIIIFKNNYY